MVQDGFRIDPDKKFPTLPRAPIVEAVIQWHAAGTRQVTEGDLRQALTAAFPEYNINPQHNVQAAFEGSSDGVEFHHKSTWQGFRLEKSLQGRPEFTCQFKRDGVVFSRLAPYGGWDQFVPEGTRFWQEFERIFEPQSIARLSVRYISQVEIRSMADVGELIDITTEPLKGLGVTSDSFFHQDTVKAGELPYIIHARRMVQPSLPGDASSKSLIVDIDVVTSDGPIEKQELETKLAELRYLKNAVFFGLMKNAEKSFGVEQI